MEPLASHTLHMSALALAAFEGGHHPYGGGGSNEGLDEGKGVGALVVAASYRKAGQGYGELSVVRKLGDAADSVAQAGGDDDDLVLRWRYVLSESGSAVDEFELPSRRPRRGSKR